MKSVSEMIVPIHPNDDQAEKFLERIRAEKEKLGSTKRKIKNIL